MAVKNLCTRTAPEEQDRLDGEWDERFCYLNPSCPDCRFNDSKICNTLPGNFTDEMYDEMRKILAE